jgi:hypothetical protein
MHYLQVVSSKMEGLAEDTASREALLKADRINEVVDKLEERYNRPQAIVQDLMASFLVCPCVVTCDSMPAGSSCPFHPYIVLA